MSSDFRLIVRVWFFLKIVFLFFWMALFAVAAVNLLIQGAWIPALIMLALVVLGGVRLRQWMSVVFSSSGDDYGTMYRLFVVLILGIAVLAAKYLYSVW